MSDFFRMMVGESQNDYNSRIDAYMREVIASAEQENIPRDKTPVILIPGHRASGDDPVAPQIFEWVDLFHNNGYEYEVIYSQSRVPPYNKAGREKVMDWNFLHARKSHKPPVFITYSRESGTKGWKNDGSMVYGRSDLATLKDIQKEVERRNNE
jgi:hypothetical protein